MKFFALAYRTSWSRVKIAMAAAYYFRSLVNDLYFDAKGTEYLVNKETGINQKPMYLAYCKALWRYVAVNDNG